MSINATYLNMDILKSLNDVTNLDEYISVTQEVDKQSKNVKVQINITTVLTLKKIRSFEIQYLDKCGETGIACIILERLLALPPSKAWGSLGNELICLIQYWLVAIRQHLLNHRPQWWSFLRLLLTFIKDIRSKSPSIPNQLVEQLTECLLDIATSDLPDAFQRYDIMHALNTCSAESSREIRFAMRNKFADHFVKLAYQMATSGYLPYQYSALECLVRWLVPRQERLLRAAAAKKWFPPDLYPETAVQIFKQTSWSNFFQDARNFLNELNLANGLVTSVVCRRLAVGDTVIISGSEKEASWLDLNSAGPCASVLLDPRALAPFGVRDFTAAFALCLTDDITLAVRLHSESGVTLSITIDEPPSVRPSGVTLGDERSITMSLSSRTDLRKMDQALKRVFGDKYQLLINLNTQVSLSPPRSIQRGKSGSRSEEDTRFSHPVEVKRKRHIGYAVRSRIPKGVNTPSSASCSSLAQLHEKLEALAPRKYDKEWVSVCAQPALSRVSELSERDDRTNSTILQYKPCGVTQNKKKYVKTTKSEIDREVQPCYRKTLTSQSDTEATKSRRCRKNMFPVVSDNEVSVLLATSIGSNDDTVINETVNRLSKKKGGDFDRRSIVDLLIEEALHEREKATDSGINTDDNKKSQDTEENSEAIEGTPVLIKKNVIKKSKIAKNKVCTVVSKSTTDDESNTEVINETPFVTSRNCSKDNAKPNPNSNTFDVNLVENFFSQHYTANKEGDNIVINPTLAKKINMTSSESSDQFDDCLIMEENFNPDEEIFQFNDIDIIECLNDVVDKVCHEFDKCSEYLREETPNEICPDNLSVTPKRSAKSSVVGKSKAQSKSKREIKIKFKTTPEKKKTKRVLAKKNKKVDQKSPKKMSTITEQADEEETLVGNEVLEDNEVQTPKVIQKDTNVKDGAPSVRQRRKLYSPKDNEIEIEKTSKLPNPETDEDDALFSDLQTKNTTPKTTVSCYKEIENERKKRIRSKPRISKGKAHKPSSPRTLKNNETFDKLIGTVKGSENNAVIGKTNLSDNRSTRKNKKTKQIEVYNFTSDSEDEDFKKKKIEVRKKISSTTISSTNSKTSNRQGRKKNPVNYSEWKSSDDEAIKPPVKRKPPAKRAAKQKAVTVERVGDLVDEKMREATDTMNTSLVIENKPENRSPNIELILKDLPEMEPISDTEEPKRKVVKKTNKKTEIVSINSEKNKKVNLKPASNEEDNKSVASISPLPGLVVEPITSRKDDADDSITANMALKFKKIYQDDRDQNESNITQNMLSDIERNNSQQKVGLSVTDEICAEYDNLQVIEETNKPIKIRVKSEFRKISTKEEDPTKEFDDKIVEVCNESYKSSHIQKPTKTKQNDGHRKTGQPKEFAEEIIELSEDKISHNSPMSIASYGINAHNDLKAAPPSPYTIDENIRPREIEDLDEPMREYYEKLNKEINKSHSDFKDKSTSEVHSKKVDKSPIVPVKRLSKDDIRKYLPSPKSSITNSESTPVVAVKRMSLDDIEKYQSQRSSHSGTEKSPIGERVPDVGKYLPSLRSSEPSTSKAKSNDTREVKSHVVNIARISLEEFDKWLPPMPKITDPTYQPSPKKRKILDPDYEPSSQKSREKFRLVFKSNKDKENSYRGSSEKSTMILRERPPSTSEEDTNEQPLTRSFTRKLKASKTTRNTVDVLTKIESNTTRKSNIISPVKSFAEFVTHLQPSDDSDDKSLPNIRRLTKPVSKLTTSKITDKLQPSDVSEEEIMDIRTFAKPKTPKFKDRVQVARTMSMERASSPIRVCERDIKKSKQRDVTISGGVPSKKSHYDDVVTMSESGPSVPSVQDWFKRTEASTKGNISESSEDAIKYILEKLDTTLRELDHNTNKKFVNLFVTAQSQLTQQKEERRKMYQNTLNDLMEYIENKFVDLDRKSREMDTQFMNSLKEQAFELLKQDCKQKRAMIALLKEDVQSVLDHIDKNRSSDS